MLGSNNRVLSFVCFCVALFTGSTAHAQKMRTGMTWTVLGRQGDSYVHVGSDGQTNPYAGDTAIDQHLPLLCVVVDGRPAPSGINFDFYNGWLRGAARATAPVQGAALTSPQAADAICASTFGPGWRMAEFHDGRYGYSFSQTGGWTFWAAGYLTPGTRFWASINDQSANPWNSVAPDEFVIASMLQNMVQPLLSLTQNPEFRGVVYSNVAARFDGDDNALLSQVITQSEQMGIVDTNSPEWQSLVAQVAAFQNVDGETYYPQIYIPNYGEFFPTDIVTMVVVENDPNVEAVPAYQIDWTGNVVFVGYVDETYAASNEVWVLSVNERIGMDPQALSMVRELDTTGGTSHESSSNMRSSSAPNMEFLNCNPTGLRNNKGLEYLKDFKIENLKGVEHWTAGKVEPRLIVVGKDGAEIGNKYYGKIKRKTVKKGHTVETFLTTWDRAVWGDYWVYKWIEIDGGPKVELSLGLGPAIKALLGVDVSLDVKATFEKKFDDMGTSIVTFTESTNITYTTGSVDFNLCSVGGEGHTGNNNIALSAMASASSTYSGYSPSRVNDGSQSTALGGASSWANAGYASGYPPQWVQLDFGVTKTFSRVVLFTSSGYPIRDYDIQIFNSTFGWQTVGQVRNNTALSITTNIGTRSARLIRIYALSGPTNQPGFVRVNEFEVY